MHFTNFYLHVLTTKDIVGNSSSKTYIIYIAKLKIGDYVQYIPDNINSTYTLKAIYSGYDKDQIIDTSYDPTEWRIMDINELGNITKLFGSTTENKSTVWFKGPIGYNNGVYLLNDICKTRYGNAILGTTARSLNIEDIELRMSATGIVKRNENKGYYNNSIQYGTTKTFTGSNIQYPSIYAHEKYSGTNISNVSNGTQIIAGNIDIIAQAKMNPNGKIGSDNIYKTLPTTSETTQLASNVLTCTQTYYYWGNTSNSYFNDIDFYNMIFGTDTNFWIASRYTGCLSGDSYVYWGIRNVDGNALGGLNFFASDGSRSYDNPLTPVVYISSGIQIKSGSGTINEPYILEK